MKAFACALLLTVPGFLPAQEKDVEWQRVYTGDDSIIEIDSSTVVFVEDHVSTKVTFASTRVGRVRFRTIYSKPQTLKSEHPVNYDIRIETIEFTCAKNEPGVLKRHAANNDVEKRYRLFDAVLFDKKGTVIKSFPWNPSEEWKEVRFGSMMEKLFLPACKLIDEKRRNP